MSLYSTESDDQLRETEEQVDHLKTLSSISGYASLGYDRLHQGPGHSHWHRASILSDGEGIAAGILLPNPVSEEQQILQIERLAGQMSTTHVGIIARTIKVGTRAGEKADAFDKANQLAQHGVEAVHNIKEMQMRRNANREHTK